MDEVLGGLGDGTDDEQVDVDVRREGGGPADALGDVVGGEGAVDALVDLGGGVGVAVVAQQRELRVCTMPGAISVTRTGVPTSSSRRVRARAPSACLAAVYPPPPGYTTCAAVDVITTTWDAGASCSRGSRARVTRRVPSTFTSCI